MNPDTTWYCDGSTYKNGQPGQDSSYIVLCPDGEIIRKHIGDYSINVAELEAIYEAAEIATYGGTIITDSQLCARWLIAFKPTKNNRHVEKRVGELMKLLDIKQITLKWVPREQNLAGVELEEHPFYGSNY